MLKINEKIFENFFDSPYKGDKVNVLFCGMICRIILPFILIWSVVFSTVCASAANTSTDKVKENILDAIEKKYTGKSFEASFTQSVTLVAIDNTQKASGKASFSHPGKMRWEYLEPERHEIITNGSSLWIYRPELNQVMQSDTASFFKPGSGGDFLSDISLVRKNYIISIKAVTAEYVEIKLISKQETHNFSSIVIRISQKNSEIERVFSYNTYDDTTTLFEFSDIQFKEIDPAIFEFNPPERSDIIKMD
ncbi:outer membrane lipoprotein carrier protein [Desulfobacula phenolica]|uniref:Outer-membrane lipoprotein carrier protein n=1 Tax=Desulfobacula phenolica TaxID=90732 RepID=A0A1H2J867_9BACT|nr:outer membrane lipoprotein carrier protein [Desulfobacula phenolica]